jgi:hypothetical protein
LFILVVRRRARRRRKEKECPPKIRPQTKMVGDKT